MANIINRQQTFSTNGTVTAAGLHNLIDTALVNSAIIKNQQEITTIGTADLLLIAPDSVDSSLAPRKVTVQNLLDDGLTAGTFTSLNLTGALTYGTATGNRTVSTSATITTGTIPNLTAGTTTSTAATITNGTITTGLIPTLTAGTTTGTAGIFTSGTVATLNSTTGTIATLNSTTGTIANLSATTSTFLGAITGSTNVVNIGSGQIYKDASGNVGIGTTSIAAKLHVSSANASDKLVRFGPGGITDENFITTAKNGVAGDTNGTPQFSLGMDYSTTYTDIAAIKFARGDGAQGNILFFTGDQANGTERLRIAPAGPIGIGGANYGTSGQALISNGDSAAPSWQTVSAITSGTAVASTSGTAIDFTGIPSGVKRITVMFSGVSLNGGVSLLVQIGSTTFSTSGYNSTSNDTDQAGATGGASSTAGFILRGGGGANLVSGILTINNISSNTWIGSHAIKTTTNLVSYGGGDGSTSATLDRVRITNTTNVAFDAGTINILYES
jgi:hypothetical protein